MSVLKDFFIRQSDLQKIGCRRERMLGAECLSPGRPVHHLFCPVGKASWLL